MDYCVLNGFLVIIFMQHCTSEGLSTSNQSLSFVSLQDVQALPHEPEVPPADVVPVVAPPSLKEVQQVMQEASEEVEGHAAEEVLKEPLEKVVEAAMGQGEGGGEAKGDEVAVQKAVTEDALGADKGESDTKDVLEQAAEEKEVEGKDMGPEGGDAAAGKEQVVADVDIAEEEERVVKKKGVSAAGSVEEAAAGVETGDGVGVINESLDTKVSQDEKGAASEEAERDLTAQEAEVEDDSEQVVFSKAKGVDETHKAEPTLRVVKVALSEEQENVKESDPGLAVAGAEQVGGVGGKEGALAEKTPVDENEPSHSYETETSNTGEGEEQEVKLVNPATGPDTENKPGQREEEGGAAGEEEAEGANVSVAPGGERHGDSEVSEKSVYKEGEQRAGEEAPDHLEPSRGSGTEHGEVPVLSVPAPDAEASVEQSRESPAPTPSPSLGQNTLHDEKSNRGNEIITPTDDPLPNDPVVGAQPTLDNLVRDVLAHGAQPDRSEAGWTNELVEDTPGAAETGEPGLEAWKIGAISAAVFLVVETAVVIFYVVKRRNRNSASARPRPCEEGRVEPEEATGGDCSDDTVPGENEQIATFDPPDVAATPTHSGVEQHQAEHATAMSDFPSSPTQEVADSGAEPDSSPQLRTSML